MKILLVEDEPRVQRFITMGLEQAGMTVDSLSQFDEVEVALQLHDFDVVVLDRLLGSQDTLTLLPRLRKLHPHLKILILSALSEVDQKVDGLEQGADDYLGKPFHIEELVARVRNLARQTLQDPSASSGRELHYEDLTIDFPTQKVMRSTMVIDLSSKEFRLLATLMSAPQRIFTRAELLQKVWSMNFDPGSNLVDVTVGRLKKKINFENRVSLIHAKRGVGYSLASITSGE